MKNNIDIFNLYADNVGDLKNVVCYPSTSPTVDPYEHNTTQSFLNPITIQGILVSISFGGLKYKYYGQMSVGAKQLLCDKKYKKIILNSEKIEIDGETYGVYADADKNLQYLERIDYLVVILERK